MKPAHGGVISCVRPATNENYLYKLYLRPAPALKPLVARLSRCPPVIFARDYSVARIPRLPTISVAATTRGERLQNHNRHK